MVLKKLSPTDFLKMTSGLGKASEMVRSKQNISGLLFMLHVHVYGRPLLVR